MTKVPNDFCLARISNPPPEGEKCEHNNGRWLVKWDGVFYGLSPSTQLQKDIWLGDARRQVGQAAQDALRWLCFDCGTIQMP